jgi:hypothetical protein
MKIQTQRLSMYSFCLFVSAAIILLLALSVDYLVSKVNNILSPCVNDGVWTGYQKQKPVPVKILSEYLGVIPAKPACVKTVVSV